MNVRTNGCRSVMIATHFNLEPHFILHKMTIKPKLYNNLSLLHRNLTSYWTSSIVHSKLANQSRSVSSSLISSISTDHPHRILFETNILNKVRSFELISFRHLHSSIYSPQASPWRPPSDLSPHIGDTKNQNWSPSVIVISTVASIALGILSFKVYGVYSDKEADASSSFFFPTWFSLDWPIQRTYAFPNYLKYVDKEYYEEINATPNFAERMRNENVQYQILDRLFRLNLVRDKFGIPLTIVSEDDDAFSMWIEPKYPTLHGPEIEIGKLGGSLWLSWGWLIKSLNWSGKINGILADFESKLDPMICGDETTRVAGDAVSIEIHSVSNVNDSLKVAEKCGDRNYRVHTQGTYHLQNNNGDNVGILTYTGVIDFTHLGINRGFRLASLELKVVEDGSVILYKIS